MIINFKQMLLVVALFMVTAVFAQNTFKFTNCGVVGMNGPTQAQVNTAYPSGNSLNGKVTINTQGIQEWTVPYTSVFKITMAGASGGSANSNGGRGKLMTGEIYLTAGTIIKIVVGQSGSVGSCGSSGGGGGSFVVNGTTSVPLMIAGGGGGFLNATVTTNYPNSNANYTTGGNASSCGTGTGGSGGNGGTGSNNGWGGGGGGYSTNGTDGSQAAGYGFLGRGYAFVNGANGGNSAAYQGNPGAQGGFGGAGGTHGCTGGAGGGGGYSGGGGSNQNSSQTAGGGGGSFLAGTVANDTNLGFNIGHGFVTITETRAKAINLDGSNDYIEGTNTDLPQGNAASTMETWYKGTDADGHIASYGRSNNNRSFGIMIVGGKFVSVGENNSFNTGVTINDNVWHHLAVSFDGSSITCYLDGVNVGSTTKTYNIDRTTFRIGQKLAPQNSEYLAGTVDEVRIWNYARSAAQIKEKMNCELPKNTSGLIANYHFNQGFSNAANSTVTTLTDSSATAANGTLYNFALTGTTSNWTSPGAVVSGNFCKTCSQTSPILSGVNSTTTASYQETDNLGWTCYCDATGKLLLAVNIANSGAVILPSQVRVKLGATRGFSSNAKGGIVDKFGYALFNKRWDIVPTTQPSTDLGVKYYFMQEDFDSLQKRLLGLALPSSISNVNQMNMYKAKTGSVAFADPNLSVGIVLTNGATPSTTVWKDITIGGGKFAAEFLVSSFSGGGGGFGGSGSPLPLQLINFNATWTQNQTAAILNWTTASENNVSHFEIMRSTDGINWSKIGSTMATNNNQLTQYSFIDNNLQTQTIVYYKLKVVDNIENQYSNIQLLTKGMTNAPQAIVYPNPSNGSFTIIANNSDDEALNYEIYNTTGQKIMQGSFTNKTDVDTENLKTGVYVLKLSNGQTIKLLID